MATRTFLQCVEGVADRLSLLQQGTLTAAAATTVTIGSGNSARYFLSARTDADARRFEGAEIYFTSGTVPVPNPNVIASSAITTGVQTMGVTFGTQPSATATFDVFLRGVSINTIKNAINDALRQMRYEGLYPLTLVTDGDMETSGTTNWTATSATLTKVSSAGNVLRDTQALRVLATAANGQAQSATINVDPTYGLQYYVQAKVRAAVGTARLIAYDVTNSANITTFDWSNNGWGIVDFQFSLPSTARQIAVILRSVANADDTYWDDVLLLRVNSREVPLPSWIVNDGQLKRVWTGPVNVREFDWTSYRPQVGWDPMPNELNPNNQWNLVLDRPVTGPIWIKASQPYPALVNDADTTQADRDWIEIAGAMELCKRMMHRPTVSDRPYWQQTYTEMVKDLRYYNDAFMGDRVIRSRRRAIA